MQLGSPAIAMPESAIPFVACTLSVLITNRPSILIFSPAGLENEYIDHFTKLSLNSGAGTSVFLEKGNTFVTRAIKNSPGSVR